MAKQLPDTGKTPTASWVVYIVECADSSLYTGVTNDIVARLDTHNGGDGARYTRSRRPVRLVYSESAADRSAAQKREHAIKRLSVRAKRDLIRTGRQGRPETLE